METRRIELTARGVQLLEVYIKIVIFKGGCLSPPLSTINQRFEKDAFVYLLGTEFTQSVFYG